MASGESTRWTVIQGAAEGKPLDRAEFARRYASIIRAYLGARWRQSPLRREIDDATQEVFLTCFKPDGPLTKADPERSFRAYLYGVVRNVGRGFEQQWTKQRERTAGSTVDLDNFEGDEEPLSQIFDRAWAASLLRQAAQLQTRRATDEDAKRRVELMALRFGEGLPIREIAERWGVEADHVHIVYRRARREYMAALREVVAEHQGGDTGKLDSECERLLGIS